MGLHLGFLTSEYPHAKITHAAGIGTSIKNLAVALRKQNVKVSIFVVGQKTDEIIDDNGIKIHLVKSRKDSFFSWYSYRKYIQNYVNRYIVSEKIDFIEAPDWAGFTIFMNLKAPIVIRFHGSDAYFCHLEKRQQKLKNFLFEKFALGKAVAYIAPTAFTGELTSAIFNIKKPVTTIHHGLSLSHFNNTEPDVFEKGLILYIGTIIRKKGVLELPDILKKVVKGFPQAKLLLIGGDAPDLQTKSASTWQMMVDETDKDTLQKIKYLGKVPYAGIQEYMKKAHICVFPTFAETLGMVTIEAMAMRKPVVNSNIGWAKELIEDGKSGFLVHPENHAEFADRILDILNDDSLRREIGQGARDRVVAKFDIEKIVIENITFYENLLKTRHEA